ncbi:MAG: HNH endonuclease signature motif containing protein, partial [Solimonas sp.]
VTDTGYTPDDYVEVHRLLWEEHFGPIPAGHTVVFRNRDKTNTRIDNLELITRAELMRRNSYHNNYPKEIGRVIQLRGQIVRQINKRARHEKQD